MGGRTARAGRSGVSVSLSGENERKMVREIIKNARGPVKSRVIPGDIIAKYAKKLNDVKGDAKRVIEEEKAEREIAQLENQTNKLKNKLKDESMDESSDYERTWFQSTEERKTEKKKVKNNYLNKDFTDTKKKNKKKKAQNELNDLDDEGKQMARDAAFQTREAKRKRKLSKIRTLIDQEENPRSGNKPNSKKKQSIFEADMLTKTSKKSVKKIRHQATSKINENKRLNKKKDGKKFRR